jgi:hypothetical protein
LAIWQHGQQTGKMPARLDAVLPQPAIHPNHPTPESPGEFTHIGRETEATVEVVHTCRWGSIGGPVRTNTVPINMSCTR